MVSPPHQPYTVNAVATSRFNDQRAAVSIDRESCIKFLVFALAVVAFFTSLVLCVLLPFTVFTALVRLCVCIIIYKSSQFAGKSLPSAKKVVCSSVPNRESVPSVRRCW